jgi:hypothetical protein
MLNSKLKTNLPSFKLWMTISGFTSILFLLIASYGAFQKVHVYERTTVKNEFQNFSTYEITKEFDKANPEVKGLKRVASVDKTYTFQKIFASLVAIGASGTCLVLVLEEEKLQAQRWYLAKFDMDMQTAAHFQVGQEKMIIHAGELAEDLMKNPYYFQYYQHKQRTEYKQGTDEEEAQEAANSPFQFANEDSNDEEVADEEEPQPEPLPKQIATKQQTNKNLLTREQTVKIHQAYRLDQIPIGQAIKNVCSFEFGSPQHKQALQEMLNFYNGY